MLDSAPFQVPTEYRGKQYISNPIWVLWFNRLVKNINDLINGVTPIIYTDINGSGRKFVIIGVQINVAFDGSESIEPVWKEV